jgi:hypothetical protein
VREKILSVLINRYFIAYLPPPPTGTPPPTGGGELRYLCLLII